MKRLLLLLVTLICISGVLSGCTMTERTADERFRRYDAITEAQSRMFWEDWDYLWLYDRETRLTKWHTRIRH